MIIIDKIHYNIESVYIYIYTHIYDVGTTKAKSMFVVIPF